MRTVSDIVADVAKARLMLASETNPNRVRLLKRVISEDLAEIDRREQ